MGGTWQGTVFLRSRAVSGHALNAFLLRAARSSFCLRARSFALRLCCTVYQQVAQNMTVTKTYRSTVSIPVLRVMFMSPHLIEESCLFLSTVNSNRTTFTFKAICSSIDEASFPIHWEPDNKIVFGIK